MRLDDVFKRCFAVVVCFLLGAAAYFQASGMMTVAAMLLAEDPGLVLPAAVVVRGASPAVAAVWPEHETSADAIVARNPFDSLTRLLGGDVPPPSDGPAEPVNGVDPYLDPPCEGARVVLISASEDDAWSFAAIAGDGQKPVLRRVGDEVGVYRVGAFGSDRVWLMAGSRRCQAGLGMKPAVAIAGAQGKAIEAAGQGLNRPSSGGAVPADIAARIRKTGEREIEVDRSVIRDVIEKQGALLGRVRVTPDREGDKVVGLRLMGIRPDTLLGTLGIENGDRLKSVNGFDISDPKSAMEVYARLSTAEHLVVSVVRRGQPMNIDVHIK